MEIILIERHKRLGSIGDIVTVKSGYARNYLIPHNIALRATQANLDLLKTRKADLEVENKKKLEEAKDNLPTIDNKEIIIIRQAGEDGRLFGSVTLRDIAIAIESTYGVVVTKSQIEIPSSIKYVGVYGIKAALHPEAIANVVLNVARSEDEAKEASGGSDSKYEIMPDIEASEDEQQ